MSTPTTLGDIEAKAKNLSAARDLLGSSIQQLEDVYEAEKRRRMPLIKSALNAAKAAEAELRAAIEAAPALFKKPRTFVMHGFKLGYQKGKGATAIADQEQTIKLIRKLLPEQVDILIATKESVVKDALQQLDAATLKKLGVRIEDSGDAVVIKPVDGAIDKLINALLKSDDADAAAEVMA